VSDWTTYRGRVAALSRSRAADDPELLDARAELRAARLEEYVERVLAEAPPLTPERRRAIAGLLTSGSGATPEAGGPDAAA